MFYLRLCEAEPGGHLESFGPAQVLVLLELLLQLQQLLAGEGSARATGLAQKGVLGAAWKKSTNFPNIITAVSA